MGISTCVTNNNPKCCLEKETRLCMVQPCDFSMEKTKVWCWKRGDTAPQMLGTALGMILALCFRFLCVPLTSDGVRAQASVHLSCHVHGNSSALSLEGEEVCADPKAVPKSPL